MAPRPHAVRARVCTPLTHALAGFGTLAGMTTLRVLPVVLLPSLLAAQVLTPPASGAAVSAYVRRVFEDRSGELWLGTNDEGGAHWDGKVLAWLDARHGFAGSAVRGISQSADGAMWFATDRGVIRWQDGVHTQYTTKNGLPDDDCWSLFADRAGTLWVGTRRGLCRMVGTRFVPLPLPPAVDPVREARFGPEVVFAIAQDRDGHLWFGTDGDGVRRWDGEHFTAYTKKDGLGGDGVRCLCVDHQGKIWVGSDGGGLSCFDGTTWRTWTSKDGLGNDRIYTLAEARDGALWISTLGAGVSRWDGGKFTQLRETAGRTQNHVQSILQARDGTLWFGFSGGLYRLAGDQLVHVTRDGPWR